MSLVWQTYTPDRIVFDLGPLTIHWYGLILVLAIIVSYFFIRPRFIKRSVLSHAQVDDLFFYLVLMAIIGGRLAHVLYSFDYYWANPEDIIKIWQGGISLHGVLLFSVLTVVWWARRFRVKVWLILDMLVPAVALGQAIGRWGNYFNQELYGRPTDNFLGIYISPENRVAGYENYSLFQPAFLYESILDFILFLILYRLLIKDRPPSAGAMGARQSTRLPTGLLTLIYFGAYSLIRFFMEFVRIDETAMLYGVRVPQLVSIVVFAISAIFIWRILNKKRVVGL